MPPIWKQRATPWTAAAAIQQLVRSESQRHYEVVIAENHPVSAILRAVEVYQPDVLVMGTSGAGPVRRALLGSVANQLLRSVNCDVLIVPRGADSATLAA